MYSMTMGTVTVIIWLYLYKYSIFYNLHYGLFCYPLFIVLACVASAMDKKQHGMLDLVSMGLKGKENPFFNGRIF